MRITKIIPGDTLLQVKGYNFNIFKDVEIEYETFWGLATGRKKLYAINQQQYGNVLFVDNLGNKQSETVCGQLTDYCRAHYLIIKEK
jgi:hypothetical protein